MHSNKIKTLNVTQAKELEILRRIVEITNSELDLTATLKEVVALVNSMTKADSIFIYLFDDKRQHLILMASKIPHKQEVGHVNLVLGEGITGWVAQKKEAVAIAKKAYTDARFKNVDVLPEDKYEALLSVPIVYKNNVIGVVTVQHMKAHVYAESSVNLIMLIAKQMSGVITSARLYEETKKKALQLDSLVRISQSITSQDYLDEILNLIVGVTARMFNSKICTIMIPDKKGHELMIKATQSVSEAYVNKPNIKVDNSISGEVLKSHQSIVIEDVRQEKRYGSKELAVKEGLTSMVAVPMVVKNEAIGVITVYTLELHHFTQEEVAILQSVANQAAVTIENTQLVQDALKSREALEVRKLVERAKGILMRMNKLTEDAAYKLIHKKSMDSCKSMKDIAESIILMDEFRK